jgi:leucyl aminopeptidase
MKFSIQTNAEAIKAKLIIIPFLEQEAIRFSWEGTSHVIHKALFSGKKDSFYSFESEGILWLLLGMGKELEYKSIQTSFRRITAKNADLLTGDVLVDLRLFDQSWMVEAVVNGLKLGTYRLSHFKREVTSVIAWDTIEFGILNSLAEAPLALEKGEKIANAQLETFRLVDLPANTVTPHYLSDWAIEAGKLYGIQVKVLDEVQAAEEGLHAFLAVGQGSNRRPCFIIMDYIPEKANKHIGLVGKGVTFDTGGLNIKTQGMVHMKCDMGGAATVLGAMQLAASLEVPYRLTAIVPCVENAVDSNAYLPSDVIGSYSGKTIEVIDTDAEGRLILADGLSYLVKNYAPEILIDFATLTGSTVGTFGYQCAALFSKNEFLVQRLREAGDAVGERLWPLPMWDSYQSEMDSEIADIKNYHGKPFAGAITAAKFLEFFTEGHEAYAHIDIAGTAFGDSEFAKTKHATAYGVHLFLKLLENL